MSEQPTIQASPTPVVPGVYGCIVKVSGGLAADGIAKDGRNVQQNYAFRGIDAVMNALAPMLVKHGLVILPRCLSRAVVEHQSKNGGTLFYVTVEAEFDFVCAADGSTHTVRMFGEAMDSADKATNKAMSAAYKYAAFQTFCIPTEGEDADETTHEIAPPMPQVPASQAVREERENTVAAPVKERAASSDAIGIYPPGVVLIERVDETPTKNPNVTKYLLTTSTGETYNTIKDQMAKDAKVYRDTRTPVRVAGKQTKWGLNLETLTRASVEDLARETDPDYVPF